MKRQSRWYKSIRFKLIVPLAFAFITLSLISTALITRESIQTTEQILTELRREIVLRVDNTLKDKLD